MEEQSQNPKNLSTPEGSSVPEVPKKPAAKQIEPPTPSYVKRKKRRAALWILVGATGAGVLTLGIIAFLGQNFGSFTVKLNNDEDASLQMGTQLAINDRGTGIQTPSTYLNVGGLTATSTVTFKELAPYEEIFDSDITNKNYDDIMYKKTTVQKAIPSGTTDDSAATSYGVYFNFTFYVRNVSTEAVTYSIKYYCTKNILPDNLYDAEGNVQSVSLEKLVRIRVYENNYSASAAETRHDSKTYAYPRTIGGTALPEYVGDPANGGEAAVECENFSDYMSTNFTVFDYSREMPAESITRYSVLMWFEGSDSDCRTDVVIPSNGSLAFAIDISAQKGRTHQSDSSAS